MPVTADQLRVAINAGATVTPDMTTDVEVAEELLAQYVGSAIGDVPPSIYDKAHLAVAVELWNQRKAPNGVLQQVYDTGDGQVATPVRIGADPLRPAYGLLERWVIGTAFA